MEKRLAWFLIDDHTIEIVQEMIPIGDPEAPTYIEGIKSCRVDGLNTPAPEVHAILKASGAMDAIEQLGIPATFTSPPPTPATL